MNNIDTSIDGKYVSRICSYFDVSNDPKWWEYAKRQLMMQFMENIMPGMIGDGLHHVMKFDYVVRDIREGGKEYLMTCKHSIARVQELVIPSTGVPSYAIIEGKQYKMACRYCGNTLILDKRGACSACGGPANGGGG